MTRSAPQQPADPPRACAAAIAPFAFRDVAKFRGEERTRPKLAQHELLEFGGTGEQLLGKDGFVVIRNAQHESVIRPHRLYFETALRPQLGDDGHAPRRVDAAAEWSQHADAPVAKFVPAMACSSR